MTIETANVILDEVYAASHFALPPGEYVQLTVSDTGCGLSVEARAHLFEPFFTTKKTGHGTGLGLPTVYGIVKQSGGDIYVYSEEGVGTTFKIYLPSASEGTPPVSRTEIETDIPSGNETILLVEDNIGVREFIHQVLDRQGYTLLQTENGPAALQLSATYSAPIHLLLTDVVMPEMNGKILAEELLQTRSNLKTLFMSGYTHEVIARHQILEPGVAFIQKPFSAAALARQVRALLDG